MLQNSSGTQSLIGSSGIQNSAGRSYLYCYALICAGAALLAALRSSPTIDEIGFMAAGVSHWQTSRFEAFAVNPPLVRMLATLPVLALKPKTSWQHLSQRVSARSEMMVGGTFIEENLPRVEVMFFLARVPCVLILLLGLFLVHRWAASLHGAQAGNVAAAIWCFSPMLLGHGSLMTPDLGAATFGLLAFYALRRWLRCCTFATALEMGFCIGLALSTKFTWIPILPICFVTLWILSRIINGLVVHLFLKDVSHIVVSVGIGLGFINALYAFDGSFSRLGTIQFVSSSWARTDYQPPESPNRFTGSWIGELPMPFPKCLLQGIDLQKAGFESEQFSMSYLLGEWQNRGWWYYYIVGVLCKAPVPVLVLSGVAVLASICLSRRAARFKVLQPEGTINAWPLWFEQLFLLFPAVSLFVFVSSETGFNRHLRYVLPAAPFICVFNSCVVSLRYTSVQKLIRILLILQAISVLWHGPHWLSYFNEAAGGPKRGGEWLLASNIDWGQDFYNLRDWQACHPEARPLKLGAYSGCDPTLFGVRTDGIPSIGELKDLTPGWYAVSVNLLHGHALGGRASKVYSEFKNLIPLDWAGYSICIYHITSRSAQQE